MAQHAPTSEPSTLENLTVLPIEEVVMPADVTDLKDVVEAINRLCDTMKMSEEELYEDCVPVDPGYVECSPELISPEEVTVRTVETYRAERWSDYPEETSEMYYTASEVSLSDLDLPEKIQESVEECVMAGHVAAMRERFESMTRANTPCPDLIASTSPSLDVFRNITPSPERLG